MTTGGYVSLSIGMTNHEEEEKIVKLFEANGRAKDLVLFNCTSGYPVPFKDVCLLEITRMREAYQFLLCTHVSFSILEKKIG